MTLRLSNSSTLRLDDFSLLFNSLILQLSTLRLCLQLFNPLTPRLRLYRLDTQH